MALEKSCAKSLISLYYMKKEYFISPVVLRELGDRTHVTVEEEQMAPVWRREMYRERNW